MFLATVSATSRSFRTTYEPKRNIPGLKPQGRFIINVTDGEYPREHIQSRSWDWIDKTLFVCRERSLAQDRQRPISRVVVTSVGKGVIVDQFYAERLYTRESLYELLKTAGFSDITFHGKFSSNSQRNQDLGLMEKRIVVAAVVRKEWTPQKKNKRSAVKNVVVILGDPNKPDPIKPCCVFDDDDLYTIDRLKEALRELKDFRFTYLCTHDTLIHDLIKLKAKIDFVFNLCDEGFSNEAERELHVPALLEMLGIPYTGSGPQCLTFCYDKSLVRGIAKEMDIPVPEAVFIKPEDTAFELHYDFPVIAKPNFGDSSFGITQRSVAYNPEELTNAISEIREKLGYDKPILVEEFLSGKDLSVGIIGNPPESYTVLPIVEEDYSSLPEGLPRICGYEVKWLQESPYWNIESVRAGIPEEVERNVVEWSLKLFERLECRDYARFDWRLDASGNPKLLEVNPNPGWCWDGHLAKMVAITGMSYKEMLDAILKTAEARMHNDKKGGHKQSV